jgi:hypothetical protein
MIQVFSSQSNKSEDKKITFPKHDEGPISVSERLTREEIKKAAQDTEEIKKLKEQIVRRREK